LQQHPHQRQRDRHCGERDPSWPGVLALRTAALPSASARHTPGHGVLGEDTQCAAESRNREGGATEQTTAAAR
jgi:hypothetical protein